MNTKGVNFQPSERGQFSTAVDTRCSTAVSFAMIRMRMVRQRGQPPPHAQAAAFESWAMYPRSALGGETRTARSVALFSRGREGNCGYCFTSRATTPGASGSLAALRRDRTAAVRHGSLPKATD